MSYCTGRGCRTGFLLSPPPSERQSRGVASETDPVYMSRKIRKFRTDKFDTLKQTEILTHATHVNGWEPAVYMSCMSQNFRLFHVSNLSVRNFRIFLLMYTGSLTTPFHRLRAERRAWRVSAGGWPGGTGPETSTGARPRGRIRIRAGGQKHTGFSHGLPESHAATQFTPTGTSF